jgi:hypothetical protein
MSAYGINSIVSQHSTLAVLVNDQVMSITLEALNKTSVSDSSCFDPIFTLDNIALCVQSFDTSFTATLTWWDEEVDKTTSHPSNRNSGTSKENKIHDGSSLHVWNKFISSCGTSHFNSSLSWHTPWLLNNFALANWLQG